MTFFFMQEETWLIQGHKELPCLSSHQTDQLIQGHEIEIESKFPLVCFLGKQQQGMKNQYQNWGE